MQSRCRPSYFLFLTQKVGLCIKTDFTNRFDYQDLTLRLKWIFFEGASEREIYLPDQTSSVIKTSVTKESPKSSNDFITSSVSGD